MIVHRLDSNSPLPHIMATTTYAPNPHEHFYAGSTGYEHAGRLGYHSHSNGSVGHRHPASVSTGHQYGHSYGPQHAHQYSKASVLPAWNANSYTPQHKADYDTFFAPLPPNYAPAMPSALKHMSQLDEFVGPASEQSRKSSFYREHGSHQMTQPTNVRHQAPQVKTSTREQQLRRERKQRMQQRQIEAMRSRRMRQRGQRKKGGFKEARLLELGSKDKPFVMDAEAGFDIYLMGAIGALMAGTVAVCCVK